MELYFDNLNIELNKGMIAANKARSKGVDPVNHVDIVLADTMAERVVGLISVLKPELKETKIVERISELEKQYGSQDWRVALTIALEIAEGKFCQFKTKLEALYRKLVSIDSPAGPGSVELRTSIFSVLVMIVKRPSCGLLRMLSFICEISLMREIIV